MTTTATPDLQQAYDRARPHVGQTQTVPLGRVHARDVQRFAIAAGDLSPEYFDEAAARSEGHDGLPVPPLYLSAVLGWQAGPPEPELLADGNATEPLGSVPLDGLRLMGGGQSLVFHEPVLVGADVTMEVVVEDLQLKEGRSGALMLLTVLRRYLDEQGRLLVECRETFIAR